MEMDSTSAPAIRDWHRPGHHDWPRETRSGGVRMLVFARCACGAVIPIDYLECAKCNPFRQMASIGHEGRDDLRIRNIKEY